MNARPLYRRPIKRGCGAQGAGGHWVGWGASFCVGFFFFRKRYKPSSPAPPAPVYPYVGAPPDAACAPPRPRSQQAGMCECTSGAKAVLCAPGRGGHRVLGCASLSWRGRARSQCPALRRWRGWRPARCTWSRSQRPLPRRRPALARRAGPGTEHTRAHARTRDAPVRPIKISLGRSHHSSRARALASTLASSMVSSKKVLRILKKVAAVSRLSLPAWCCGPMRSIWIRPGSQCVA